MLSLKRFLKDWLQAILVLKRNMKAWKHENANDLRERKENS